jgi:hypothetical protein
VPARQYPSRWTGRARPGSPERHSSWQGHLYEGARFVRSAVTRVAVLGLHPRKENTPEVGRLWSESADRPLSAAGMPSLDSASATSIRHTWYVGIVGFPSGFRGRHRVAPEMDTPLARITLSCAPRLRGSA